MNLSALFIKRPVTTTLHHAGHHGVRRDGVPAAAGQRPADRRLPHHPGQRRPAGRQPRDDGVGGGAAARETVRDDRRPQLDQLDQLAGQHQHHAAVRSEPQHRRRRAGRAGDDRAGRRAQLPPQMPAPPSYQKVESRRSAGAVPGAAVADAAAVDGRRVRARRPSRSASRWSAASRRCNVFGAAEVRRARRRRSAQARGARHRHRRGRRRDHERQRQPADRHDLRRRQTFVVQANGQLLRAAAYGPTIIAYRNGNPVRLDEVAHVYDGVENDKTAALVQRRARDLSRDPEAAGHQRRRGRRRGQGAAADVPRAAAGVGVARRPHRPLGADPRVGARRQVHAAADRRPGRAGDLPVPAQHLGDDHPQPRAAGLDRRRRSR